MALPYPVDSPGYVSFPGTSTNNLTVPATGALVVTGDICVVVKVVAWDQPTATVIQSFVARYGNIAPLDTQRSWFFGKGTSAGKVLRWSWSANGSGVAENVIAGGVVPDAHPWIAIAFQPAVPTCRFFSSLDGVTWVAIGSSTASVSSASMFGGTAPIAIGSLSDGTLPFPGDVAYVSIRSGVGAGCTVGGTEVFRFDATTDLAGVPANATTFVPSIPTTSLVTVNSQAVAAGQGYATFPGTLGNYLQVADAVPLDILGALTVVWRERARDLTPTRLGQSILSKAATASQFSYRVTHGPRDFIFGRSNDGATIFRTHTGELGTTNNPFTLDRKERWIWFCLTFDTVPTNAVTRLWWCEDDSLTPPAAARWSPTTAGALNATADTAAKTIFNGSSPLLIGAGTATDPSFNGDIGYLSLRTGGSNVVLGGTEVWRMDADNLVNLLPDPLTVPTITPSVGGAATVVRTSTPKDTGFIEFPGTPSNYLSMIDAVGDFTDTISFYAKVTRDDWSPPVTEVIVGKWGDIGQRSYLWLLEPTGQLTFYWTTTGGVTYTVSTADPINGEPVPVPDPGAGVPLFIGMSTTRSGVNRTIQFWTSTNAISWTQLGTTHVYPQASAHALFNSNAPLGIGAAVRIAKSIATLNTFNGRMLEVAGSDGAGGFFGGVTDVVERFRIGPEHLQISPSATSFPAIGGTVTVTRVPYPNDFGVWRFPGTRGNYLQVPDAANLRLTNNFCAEVRIAPDDWTPQDTDRLLIGKSGASGQYGWQFLLSPRGTLKMVTSANGTVLDTAESSLPVPLQNYFSKRVAVTYVSTDRVRFWMSDNGVTWDKLGVDAAPSGVLFASNAPVQIGVTYPGALTDASIRDGVGLDGEPLLDTEVFLMDQGCLNIDPQPPFFTSTTGQVVTVFTDDISLDNATQGWVDLPGTLGNYLDTPDHVSLDINGSMTIIIRFAPNDWTRTGKIQTLVAKWSAAAGNYSYLLQLMPNGVFRFTWSVGGTVTTSLDTGVMASAIDGEFRMFAFTVEKAATTTLRRWESSDFGNSWVLRDTASTSFGPGAIFQGNAPLTIGANNNTEHFEGRISYLDIRNGIGTDGAPGGTRALWWSAESLHINTLPGLPTVATFVEETGKTISIRRAVTPTIPGSVDFYGRVGDRASTPVPTLASTTGITVVTRLDLSETRPSKDYLVAGALSTTQTPRPNIVGDVFISFYGTVRAGSTDQYLAAAWWPQTETSWRLYIDGFSGGLRFTWTEDGINPTWATPLDLVSKAQLAAMGTGLVFLGVQIERNVLGKSRFTAMTSADQGATWTPIGTVRNGPLMEDTWPADPLKPDSQWKVRLTVGGAQTRAADAASTLTVTNGSWLGRIQWVQMTEFPSDTLLWRFDSTEWPGGDEILFTDPRARGWRMDSKTAITELEPTEPPDEQIIVQRWDEATNKCSFSLRSIADGFSFSMSDDGTEGGGVDIPMDDDVWHPNEQMPGKWGWLAVTSRVSGEDTLIRIFTSPDTGTGTVPTTWTEVDTQVTAADVGAFFVDTAEVITIGGDKTGKLPFIGRISHLSLRDGTGTNGVVGGTERFRIDLSTLYGVASNAATFPAGTGQTVSMLPNTAERLADITPTPAGMTCFVDGPNPLYDGSPPGPTLYLDPAPVGPMLTISPSTDGPVTVITPSPPAPTTELVGPSLDRTWWPGQTAETIEDPTKWWTQPAFTVQRLLKGPGAATGGDYVRGSANVNTEKTALRFPTSTLEGLSAEGVGKGILYALPHPDAPYDTVTLEWNFPTELTAKGHTDSVNNAALDSWLQVAIVRSAFGAPTTVNDGQTVFLTTRSALFPSNPTTPTIRPYTLDDDGNILTPDVYDPRVPRSSDDDRVPKLPGGRWYYYSLFFLVDTKWLRAASDHVLLPRNHHHAEHLWDALPPYYRWADEQEAHGSPGHLQRFLAVFGYDLDLTREMVESWQNMYQTDFTPMALLRRIGETFGIPYESTIGDIRYRALIAKIGFLYIGRGTTGTLRRYIAAASKCDCDVVTSPNIMLLPDDSDFFAGTGNWAGLHTGTTISGSGIPVVGSRLTPDKIRLDHGIRSRPAVPASAGRGSMHVWSSKADATTSFIITCGDGERYTYDTGAVGDTDRTNDTLVPPGLPESLIPRFHGIHVKPNQVVAFSVYACADPEAVNTVVQPMLMFFDKEGQPSDYISHDISNAPVSLSLALDAATGLPKWYLVVDDAPVPANTVYCVPALIISGRPAGTHATLSPMVHFAGAQFIVQGDITTVSGTDPAVQMLTLDYPGETIGGPFGGFIDSKLGAER